jgi:hypothetical protein
VSHRITPTAFLGSWHIETMELWDRDAIELPGPAPIIFEDEAFGEFRFIAVHGWMDCASPSVVASSSWNSRGLGRTKWTTRPAEDGP